MGNIYIELVSPGYWQDFERLTLDKCVRQWKDDYAQRNGRAGQEQAGVDVFGYNHSAAENTGVQCKKRKNKSNGRDVPSSSLTVAEIDAEIANAETFEPPLKRFVIATTAPADVDLQEHVRLHNVKGGTMKVALWFWEDYIEFLNNDTDMLYRYYENVLRYRGNYAENEHYLRMLAVAFDRPAMRTTLHLENRMVDFIDALGKLEHALRNGILKDRENLIIDEVRPPKKFPSEIKQIMKFIASSRELATQALLDGRIIQHESVIEIRDLSVRDRLNTLRQDAVKQLNSILSAEKIDPIEIASY